MNEKVSVIRLDLTLYKDKIGIMQRALNAGIISLVYLDSPVGLCKGKTFPSWRYERTYGDDMSSVYLLVTIFSTALP